MIRPCLNQERKIVDDDIKEPEEILKTTIPRRSERLDAKKKTVRFKQ